MQQGGGACSRPGTARRCEPPPAQRSPPDELLDAVRAEVLQRGPHVFIDENMLLAAGQEGRFSSMKKPPAGCSLARLQEKVGKLRRSSCW